MHDFANNADDDRELLAGYAGGDEQAFRALVERYSGLVYGTAMRRLANEEWAGDAAQNVFAALAAKAPALVRENVPSVGAWLHRAATFESKRVLRDRLNQQNREAMIREELSKAGDSNDALWDEIRPELDEALEKLSSRDRDVLVLHYFDGMKFKQVAARLGMRPDAARKRCKRALEKLAGLLSSRRGAAVSSAVLSAGLAPELAQAAPAWWISKLVTTNAAASASAAGSAALITAMSTATKTTTTFAAALAVLAVPIGTGYLVGDTTRDERSGRSDVSDTVNSSAPERSADKSDTGRSQALSEGLGASTAEQFITRLKDLMQERAQLMQDGKRRQEAGATEQELDEVFAQIEALFDRGNRATDGLSVAQVEAALGLLEGESAQDISALGRRLLFSSLGKRDPTGALGIAASHAEGSEALVFIGWGMVDPAAALQKQKEIAAKDRVRGRAAMSGLFEGWLSIDPAAALATFEGLSFDEQKPLYQAFGHLTRQPSTRPALLAAVAEVADEKLRSKLVQEVGGDWAGFAPTQVFAWFDSLEFENSRLAIAPVNVIFSNATRRGGDRETAVTWIWGHLPDDQKGPFLDREIKGVWKINDPAAAAAWMERNGIKEAEVETP